MAPLGAHRRLVLAVLCALVALGLPAAAVAVPTGVTHTSAPNDATPAFAWNGAALTTFDWELTGPGAIRAGATALSGVEVAPAVPDGTYSFRVREVSLGVAGEWSASATAVIDTAPPTIAVRTPSAGSSVPAGAVVIADYSCEGAITCRAGVDDGRPVGTLRAGQRIFTVDARDAAGNAAQLVVPWSVFDRTPPTRPIPTSPIGGTTIGLARPTLSWSASTDLGGIARYEVFLNAVRRATTGAGVTRWTAPQNLAGGPYRWSVRAVDLSGNVADSVVESFIVDTSSPPPPTITAQPADPGSDTTPTLAWTGTGPTYTWTLRRPGQSRAVAGPTSTAGGSVTLGPLVDGPYLIRLNQTNAFGRRSADVEVAFAVDAAPPGTPVVTSRPPGISTTTQPSFSWQAAEPGGSFAWQVLSAAGPEVQAAPSVSPEATIAPLAPGSYAFVVRQVDDAGNVGSPSTAESFAISGPPAAVVAAAPPAVVVRRSGKIRPATITPRRLKPRPGVRVRMSRGVTLRWAAGPPRTRLYNLQIFEIRSARSIVKVLSRFPRRTEYTVPRGTLRAGKRYIWRIWPSLAGGGLTPRPVGVSFFDVAPVARKR